MRRRPSARLKRCEAVRAQRLGRQGMKARDVPAVRSLGAQVGWQASVPRLECACGGGCCDSSREICMMKPFFQPSHGGQKHTRSIIDLDPCHRAPLVQKQRQSLRHVGVAALG